MTNQQKQAKNIRLKIKKQIVEKGSTKIVCGSMYSGKSEELIRHIKRCIIGNLKVQLFKPIIDNRYSNDEVVTHAGEKLKAINVKNSQDLFEKVIKEGQEKTQVVGIDEVQFFDLEVVDIVKKLNDIGIDVICAGLDMDSTGKPFGPVPYLLAIADEFRKLHAVCSSCGDEAYISHYVGDEANVNTSSQVKLGSFGEYIALCKNCRSFKN